MQKQKSKKPGASKPARAVLAHQVRIIGGQWKRTPLAVLNAEGLRPTPDRVRETVFNWIDHLFDRQWANIACLDLFAGTGALGFEAASRGAGRVVMIEENTPAVRQLEATREKLHAQQVSIQRADALSTAQGLAARMDGQSGRFDLIFLDPPYHEDWLAKMLPLCGDLLTEEGLVYAEAEQSLVSDAPPAWLDGWSVVRAGQAGMVCYHLLQRNI
ncbi:MAG: 16S rRNA (guanine(966)-N(2))-methyltransferase RsmD [Pseudomonadota bacterium]